MNKLEKIMCTIGAAFSLAGCASKLPEPLSHQCDAYDRHITVNDADGRGVLVMGTRTDAHDIALKTGDQTLSADVWANGGVAADHNGVSMLQTSQMPQTGDTLQVVIGADNQMKSCALVNADGDVRATFKPGTYTP